VGGGQGGREREKRVSLNTSKQAWPAAGPGPSQSHRQRRMERGWVQGEGEMDGERDEEGERAWGGGLAADDRAAAGLCGKERNVGKEGTGGGHTTPLH
jgi:hypothetical protein